MHMRGSAYDCICCRAAGLKLDDDKRLLWKGNEREKEKGEAVDISDQQSLAPYSRRDVPRFLGHIMSYCGLLTSVEKCTLAGALVTRLGALYYVLSSLALLTQPKISDSTISHRDLGTPI